MAYYADIKQIYFVMGLYVRLLLCNDKLIIMW